MIEFSENLNTRYTGKEAFTKRVFNRLHLRYNEVPYYKQGLDVQEFTYDTDLQIAVKKALYDVLDVKVVVSGDRVLVGDISVTLPEIL